MPSRADVERYAQANRDIRTLVLRDLGAFWLTLDSLSADETRDALLDVVPVLVTTYGDTAAAIAADYYDDLRDAAGVRGRFTATLADNVDFDTVASRVRWSVSPLYSANPDRAATLGRLAQNVDELTLRPGRDTIAESAGRDPAKARWARVPVGKTCAFCLMTASRGAVYRSEQSAGRKYHGDCDCTPTPIWEGQPLPQGYDPDALYEQYNAARQVADSSRTKAILAELRESTGGH